MHPLPGYAHAPTGVRRERGRAVTPCPEPACMQWRRLPQRVVGAPVCQHHGPFVAGVLRLEGCWGRAGAPRMRPLPPGTPTDLRRHELVHQLCSAHRQRPQPARVHTCCRRNCWWVWGACRRAGGVDEVKVPKHTTPLHAARAHQRDPARRDNKGGERTHAPQAEDGGRWNAQLGGQGGEVRGRGAHARRQGRGWCAATLAAGRGAQHEHAFRRGRKLGRLAKLAKLALPPSSVSVHADAAPSAQGPQSPCGSTRTVSAAVRNLGGAWGSAGPAATYWRLGRPLGRG